MKDTTPSFNHSERDDKWILEGGKLILAKSKLIHLSMEDHYANIHWKDQNELATRLVRISLKKSLDQLDADNFIQIHRSHLINVDHLEGVYSKDKKWFAIVASNHLPVSKKFL